MTKEEIKLAYEKAKAGDWRPMSSLFRRGDFDLRLLDDEVIKIVADKLRDG